MSVEHRWRDDTVAAMPVQVSVISMMSDHLSERYRKFGGVSFHACEFLHAERLDVGIDVTIRNHAGGEVLLTIRCKESHAVVEMGTMGLFSQRATLSEYEYFDPGFPASMVAAVDEAIAKHV